MKVLVIDDDPVITEVVSAALGACGHQVEVAHTGARGAALARTGGWDAVVLDLVLPDVLGVEVLRGMRARGDATPVLMLTTRSSAEDVIRGLDAGADAYLAKPFHAGELEARLRAVARRREAGVATLSVGDLRLDRVRHEVSHAGRPLRLTAREYSLLAFLLEGAGRVVSRAELLEKVWDLHFDPGSNVVDVHVARVRARLQAAGSGVALATVRGTGFVLHAPEPAAAGA